MNIYFFIQDISLTGGTERVTVNLSNLFVSKGHKVTIVSFNRGKEKVTYQPVPEVGIVYLSNELYPIDSGYIARLRSFYHSIKALKHFFRSQINKNEENAFISQNFFANTLLWLAGKSKDVLGCEHFKYDLYPKPVRALRCFVYSFFKKIIVLTDKDRARFCKHLSQNKVVTIPNMAIAKEDFKLDLNSKTIIAVGRLHPQKGFDMLISATKDVFDKYPNWQLNIFGEGELKDALQSQIQALGLQRNIFLKGYTDNINGEFAKSAFFVLSSRYEGFPMVLVEAMSLGMPSVAFDCPEGPAQLLAEGGGILVEKENIPKLSEAMVYMIEHPDFRQKCSKHREFIKEHLSPKVIYEKWRNVFETK